eukprot:1160493-Pelagomonas_calceolata.AAC.10
MAPKWLKPVETCKNLHMHYATGSISSDSVHDTGQKVEAAAEGQPQSKGNGCSPTSINMMQEQALQDAQRHKPGALPYDLLTILYANPCNLGLDPVLRSRLRSHMVSSYKAVSSCLIERENFGQGTAGRRFCLFCNARRVPGEGPQCPCMIRIGEPPVALPSGT